MSTSSSKEAVAISHQDTSWQALQINGVAVPLDSPRHRSKLPKEQLTEKEQEQRSWSATARGFFPIAEWLPKYGYDCQMHKGCASEGTKQPVKDGLRRDIMAGFVIGIMLVPQGMAYSLLAGLPPVYGLYGSIWPQIAYTIFGTCRVLGPGVNAPISLLMVDALNFLPDINGTDCSDRTAAGGYTPDCMQFIEYSMLLALVVSVLYIIMAVLQLGVITAFMPEPALSGFTSGAAIVIVTSQLKHFIGMPNVPRGGVPQTIVYIFSNFGTVPNVATFLMGLFSLAVLIVLKAVNMHPKMKAKLPIPIPEQLVILIIAILISLGGDLNGNYGVPIVGTVPAGIEAPVIPTVTMSRLGEVIGPATTVALVTYILTINVAKAVASKKDLNVNATQEFFALSSATFFSSLFNGALPSGSFSRTALLMLLNVESPLHNLFTALFVVCVCLFMTSLLTLLPMCTLAAIIFMALKSMFNVRPAFILWKVSKIEWAQWMTAFFATALLGVTWGIFASIIFSVILLLKTSARPPTAVLGVVPGTNIFLPIKRYDQAKEIPGIKIFRFTAALTFANREHFEANLQKMHYQNVNTSEDIHTVVVDCSSVTSVDTSALKLVERVVKKYNEKNILLLFANWQGVDEDGRRVMNHLKFGALLGQKYFFYFIQDAINYANDHKWKLREKKMDEDENEKGEKTTSSTQIVMIDIETTMGKGVVVEKREDGTEVIQLKWKLANDNVATMYKPSKN
jgi:SulP family sulfate permease